VEINPCEMKLTKIEIKGLFDLFDYDIPLTNEESLLIITGPNGFGKTMILNIIFSFFNNRLHFFQKLVFKSISMWTDDGKKIFLKKEIINNEFEIFIYEGLEIIARFSNSQKIEEGIIRDILRHNPNIRQIDDRQWLDRLTDRILSVEELLNDYSTSEKHSGTTSLFSELTDYSSLINVHIIKEQRLLRRTPQKKRSSYERGNDVYIIDTIAEYANELRDLINSNLQDSFSITQRLDSSFPKRLLNERGHLTIEEFDIRFNALREKQEKLNRFGISQSEQEVPNYDAKNANVLLVYLKDSEIKMDVFDELLNKLELFTSILNERRFTHKSIKIDRKKGFIFLTKNGIELSLTDLSSGEQHEVVLLYELIFKTNPNTLVLIDEPEISLHVTWQKEFLSDLLKILELQKMQVIVATHSPQIINDRWDLVFNLETQMMQ
jgi:predicted ATP-binding protein involved in virulence